MQQFKNITLIISSTIIGGIMSYMYHPIMNHYLNMVEFSKFESLAGVFAILSTITVAFAMFLIKAFSQSDVQAKRELYRGSERIFMYIGICLYIFYILLANWINIWLSIGDIYMVILVGSIIPITFISISPTSWLQSEGRFGHLALYAIFGSFLKLLFGFILAVLGFGVFGAIGGFLLSALVATILIFVLIQRSIGSGKATSISHIIRYFRDEYVEIFHFFLLSGLLSILQNIDIVFANRFLVGSLAGEYAFVSIMMKFVIFIGISVEVVYYPKLAHSEFLKKDILHAGLLIIVGSIVGYICLRFGGIYILELINPLLVKYQELINYLYVFCILFVCISLILKFAIAQRIYIVNIMTLSVVLLLIIYLEQQVSISLIRYITIYIVTAMVIFFLSTILILYNYFLSKKKYIKYGL